MCIVLQARNDNVIGIKQEIMSISSLTRPTKLQVDKAPNSNSIWLDTTPQYSPKHSRASLPLPFCGNTNDQQIFDTNTIEEFPGMLQGT